MAVLRQPLDFVWQVTQELHQENDPAENWFSQKRDYSSARSVPWVSLTHSDSACTNNQGKRKAVRSTSSGSVYIHPVDNGSKGDRVDQLLKCSRCYFLQKKIFIEFPPQRLQNILIPTFLLEHVALGWTFSVFRAVVLPPETIHFSVFQGNPITESSGILSGICLFSIFL